ncbi:GAF domain-containing protein [Microseira wollei]|uniref:Circadian input-output histidine kinase CikA n=1 Tax=Microseira wollei NIES-4236 TaxID=2530354 RepID=A0AAV3WG74_9CYAN|nr:GAF domain-containing protein [Microseira wollei]GET37254.1 GAF sensor signal transduction histidine kinase [Microseira wollei NIES-4236]
MSNADISKNPGTTLDYGGLLHRIVNRIRQSLELKEILSATVAETRSFLQTDRVKVYRFHPDGSGQVIAESVYQNRLPSLLDLNFPAGDIPPGSREMLIKAGQRSIVDVAAQQITLSRLEDPITTGDLTIGEVYRQPIADILKRPVDPCHVEYLTAMGVQSSLVVPILYQNNLWGLLASHHSQPQAFSEEALAVVQLVADQLSIAIAQSELLAQTREQVRREAMINQISSLLHSPRNMEEILQLGLERIVRAVQGSGGRLYLMPRESTAPVLYTCGAQTATILNGDQPSLLEETPFWQQLMAGKNQPGQTGNHKGLQVITDLYQEEELKSVTWIFGRTRIRGLLVMPLQYSQESIGCLTIFRDAIDTEINWGGYWEKDERQQLPRKSFQLWREQRKNQPPKWTREDIDLVQSLGIHLAMAMMQNRLYQAQKHNLELNAARAAAEEASRLKSNFIATTSHELRTPLTAVLNFLQLLKEGYYDNEEQLKKYIQLAHQSANNLVNIINDVLDIAKIEAGRMTVDLEPVSLMPLLEEQRNLFGLESQRRGIKLVIECECDRVLADKDKLRQVLINLLSNAFKFTQTGEVRVSSLKRAREAIVEISVTDTGIGITTSEPESLFEPFVQEDSSIKRHYGGTGLGLAICKRLVELMGGQIYLKSPGKNEGTTVTFTLPDVEGELTA